MNPVRLRISATTLESFRLFKQAEWYSWEKFYQELMGFRSETPEMRVGTVFHKIMDSPDKYLVREFSENGDSRSWKCDDMTFTGMDKALEYREFRAIRELKAVAPFRIGQYEIELACKADAIYGGTIWEYKTRARAFDADKATDLLQSLQWQAYCQAFGARRVIYVVSQLEQAYSNGYDVVEVVTMEMHKYPDAEAHLRRELTEFVGLLEERYLLPYFQPRAEAVLL